MVLIETQTVAIPFRISTLLFRAPSLQPVCLCASRRNRSIVRRPARKDNWADAPGCEDRSHQSLVGVGIKSKPPNSNSNSANSGPAQANEEKGIQECVAPLGYCFNFCLPRRAPPTHRIDEMSEA